MSYDVRIRPICLALAGLFACCLVSRAHAAEGNSPAVGFNRQIRPILSDKCLQCHGPDESKREADLRLDDPEDVASDRGGYRVLAAGKPAESELYLRITSDDETTRMPPADSGKQLSQQEKELIRLWIEQGAQYEKHWSLIPPVRPAEPQVVQSDWPRGAIDRYVLARLESAGLRPSAEADRGTLLRRVSLDLTGLPPTLEELDAFLADDSPAAYETAVERLLESPRYGEHMARYWLDASRYADTNGFFSDRERSMWRWRDWVIDAFNRNMGFDQFTVEQLAGDLLSDATLSQRLATGFNRNHMTTAESGVIDEEYRVEYVVDRVETTAVVWLGLTMGCARCHDHKYDPITQREFYRFFAFFNNQPETGLTKEIGNSPPVLQVPTTDYTARLEALRLESAEADKQFEQLSSELDEAQSKWEQTALDNLPAVPADGLVGHVDMETLDQPAASPQAGERPSGQPVPEAGLFGTAARFAGDAVLERDADFSFERTDPFSFGAWINPNSGNSACILSKNDDLDNLRGFDVMTRKGKYVAHLIDKWNTSAIQVATTTEVASRWQHLMVTYDGSSEASGVKIYVDGKLQPVEIRVDSLRGSIATAQPLRIGRRSTSAPYSGLIDEVRIYNRELGADEVDRLAGGQLVRNLVGIAADQRTADQQRMLRDYFLAEDAAPQFRQAGAKADELRRQLQELEGSLPTTMVMQEMDEPRDAWLLVRGQYDQHGEKVTCGVPASLPSLADLAPANRLGLARWLIEPSHPLTARVTVNRFWQQLFGSGIVKTVEDFGSQGEWPSHPDLLDWLAVEFVESGWDVKHILRLIVTSATYRQSSSARQADGRDLQQIDPENRLLARGPRFRLDAEVVRDNALAIGGLLTERIGGKSVMPYQPPGLWEAVSYDGDLTYPQDHGESLYRRSLYTYWKRQSPPPAMLAFDAPTRETCTVRRPRTNTPLQALALMNDTTYVEAARALAERTMKQAGASPPERIRFVFRLATARLPEADEVDILLDVFGKQVDLYRQNVQAAQKLLDVGEAPRDTSLDPAEHAAWTTIASMILNMDQTVTKN